MNETGSDTGAQIELKLRDVHQLFHSLEPSSFREKDLDKDAEEFIVACAKELSGTDDLSLKIHLQNLLPDDMNESSIGEAVRNYFTYQADRFAHRDRELLREGWKKLGIGISFLASCLIIAQYLLRALVPVFATGASLPLAGFSSGAESPGRRRAPAPNRY